MISTYHQKKNSSGVFRSLDVYQAVATLELDGSNPNSYVATLEPYAAGITRNLLSYVLSYRFPRPRSADKVFEQSSYNLNSSNKLLLILYRAGFDVPQQMHSSAFRFVSTKHST
jgi:hypothetical protein